jgi:hypothetical protein
MKQHNCLLGFVLLSCAIVATVAAGAERRRAVLPEPEVVAELDTAALPPAATHIISVVRCKVVDTRNADGPFGGPRLIAGVTRTFVIPSGPCAGIPPALGYALTFTAIGPDSNAVEVRAWPTGGTPPTEPTVVLYRGMASPADTLPRAAAIEPSPAGSIDVGVSTATHLMIEIGAYYVARIATSTPAAPMVRWGNATAPAGTTLLYSGMAFGNVTSNYGRENICLAGGDPGPATNTDLGDRLVAASTYQTQQFMPPGITAQRLIRCAAFLAPRPAFVLWGSWSGPDGWIELYRGYVMSPHYSHNGSSRHCVDNTNFDATIGIDLAQQYNIWMGNYVALAPPAQPYTVNTWLRCSVWMMPPP